MRDQRKNDANQLRLLAIFHFVFAGLAIVGLGFIALHYMFMHTMFSNPEMWKNQKGGPPPEQFFAMFIWLYVFFAAILIGGGIINLVSAFCIHRRKRRMFSLVVAGIDCLQIPFGTILGVFTIIVLLRDSVQELYDAEQTGGCAGEQPRG